MNTIILDIFSDFAKGMSFDPATEITQQATTQAITLLNNPGALIIAIILIAATIFIIFFLKKIITNSILGLILWGITTFGFNIQLPLIPSFVIAVIFGPAGIGVMLILKFFGLLA